MTIKDHDDVPLSIPCFQVIEIALFDQAPKSRMVSRLVL